MNVYVIASAGGMCKVGVALDPLSRMGTLSTGHPYKLTVAFALPLDRSAAYQVEREAHRILAEHRMSGEWFMIGEAEAIEAVRAASALPRRVEPAIQRLMLPCDPPRPSQEAIDELGEECASEIIALCLWGLGKADKPLAVELRAIAEEGLA